VGAHVFYELAAGVSMPLASRLGIAPTAVLYGTATAASYREAGRRPPSADPAFNALNGLYLGLVAGHALTWPRRWAGVPWFRECEGLRGPVLTPYNLILQLSWMAAVGGIVENRRGRCWGALVPVLVVPVLARAAPREFDRLVEQVQDGGSCLEAHPRIGLLPVGMGGLEGQSVVGIAGHKRVDRPVTAEAVNEGLRRHEAAGEGDVERPGDGFARERQ
jgi:hypothetical protein